MRLGRLPAKESHGSASQEPPTPIPDGGFISVWHFGLTQSKTRALNSPDSPAQLALRRLLHRPAAVARRVLIVLFIVVAAFAPLIAPYDPVATSWTAIRKA